jgi:hypothetical protein
VLVRLLVASQGQEDKYVYGHAYCFKDTAAAARIVPKSIWNSREDCTQTQVGRSVFYHRVRLVTKEDIANGYNGHKWRPEYYQSYADKVRVYITPCIINFEKELKESIPVWVDQRSMFGRLECKHIADALDISTLLLSKLDKPEGRAAWLPSYDNILELAVTADKTDRPYAFYDYICFLESNHIFSKPFFRKWINAKCTEALDKFNDLANEYHRKITAPYKQIFRLARSIKCVDDIWPDCPIDFYQTNVDALLAVDFTLNGNNSSTAEWLRQHMPVQSFFTILSKFYLEQEEERKKHPNMFHAEYGINTYRFSDWADTDSMISRILAAGKELAPPKRWRISEFHDYVQAENWKIVNPNEKLHQDLFPDPVKVELDFADGFLNTWTFFQPHDTHQLAMWGQAVRNCVGSASHYAADIKKRKHFIVLAMIENKPKFTIQLKVDMGVMSVCQIAGIGNERLDDTERELYAEAFQLALHERETQLKS